MHNMPTEDLNWAVQDRSPIQLFRLAEIDHNLNYSGYLAVPNVNVIWKW